jgi:predicted TIM-barrel fold metal-dependent hydrolase
MKNNLFVFTKQGIGFFIIVTMLLSSQITFSQQPENIKLKDYRPISLYATPQTILNHAKYNVIDVHSHPYARSEEQLTKWIQAMDETGIEKTVILSMATGPAFDSIYQIYAKYGDRFEVWCGFDYTGYDQPGFGPAAVKELERCYRAGARGVGELGDKGLGELYSKPVAGIGLHIDDPRMKPLFEKCAELGMPVNIHVAEPIWMYQKMDSTNDGLMNAYDWRINFEQKNRMDFDRLIQTLENAVRENPKTIFIACHYANCNHNLQILGKLLDKYPNLYADIAARYAEASPVPRYTRAFFIRYQNRLLYGTDMGMDASMYKITFRILETSDEHFYETELSNYHWSCNGLGLPDKVLKKVYNNNASKILIH